MLKKIIRKIVLFLQKLPIIVTSLISIIRFGGYTKVNISVTHPGGTLNNKRILITGGGSGIGLAIARKAINEGASVLITGRNPQKLKEAADSVKGCALSYLVWDISETSSFNKNYETAMELLGGSVDILVNNAGVLMGGAFPHITEEIWDTTYAINSRGLFFLTQHICSYWMKEDPKKIRKVINISSQGGFVGATYPYRMTKWDIAGFTQGLGAQLANRGIIVNGIAPGVVVTNMQKSCQAQKKNAFYNNNSCKRFALPEEIAELAGFLMGDSSNFIVGQTIVCDGGFSIK